MKFIVKVTYTCPEGAIENVKHIVCDGDDELEDILALNYSRAITYRSYGLSGVVEELDKREMEALVRINSGWEN